MLISLPLDEIVAGATVRVAVIQGTQNVELSILSRPHKCGSGYLRIIGRNFLHFAETSSFLPSTAPSRQSIASGSTARKGGSSPTQNVIAS